MTVTGAKQPLNVQKNSSGFNGRRWFYKDDCERKVKKIYTNIEICFFIKEEPRTLLSVLT